MAPGLHTETRHGYLDDRQAVKEQAENRYMSAFMEAGRQQADPQKLAAVKIEQQIQ